MSRVALSWSGGKDSALALWVMREELGIEPAALLTTYTEAYDRVSMHGVRRELVRAQAAAAGLELVEIGIPAACVNEVYEQRMAAALAVPPLADAETIAFADLYLEEIRAYREERLAGAGREALFPLTARMPAPGPCTSRASVIARSPEVSVGSPSLRRKRFPTQTGPARRPTPSTSVVKRWSGPSRVRAAHETGSFSFEAGWTGRVALWANSTVPVLASTAIADVRPRGTDGARSELVSRETRSPGAASRHRNMLDQTHANA